MLAAGRKEEILKMLAKREKDQEELELESTFSALREKVDRDKLDELESLAD
jgi:hypothetical protein